MCDSKFEMISGNHLKTPYLDLDDPLQGPNSNSENHSFKVLTKDLNNCTVILRLNGHLITADHSSDLKRKTKKSNFHITFRKSF